MKACFQLKITLVVVVPFEDASTSLTASSNINAGIHSCSKFENYLPGEIQGYHSSTEKYALPAHLFPETVQSARSYL